MAQPVGTSPDARVGVALVAAQSVLLAGVALAPRRRDWPRTLRVLGRGGQVAGLALFVVGLRGLGDSLSPFPAPVEHGRLRTDGAYAYVRHPVYAGLLLGAGSRALGSGNPWAVTATVTLAAVLRVKVGLEERLLAARYPEYDAYAARTGRFLPRARTEDRPPTPAATR